MPKSRHRLTTVERAKRNARRSPANLPTGGNTMGRLISYLSATVPKELAEKKTNYNKLQRTPPEPIWDSEKRGTFRGSIRSTFTGARRNNLVAKAA